MTSLYLRLAGIAAILIALAAASAWIHHKGVESGKHSRDKEVSELNAGIGERDQAIAKWQVEHANLQALAEKCSSTVSLFQQQAKQAKQRAADALAQARAASQRNAVDTERLLALVTDGAGKTCEQGVSEIRAGLRTE